MELTKKQAQGLDIAIQRYKNGEKYTVIAGFAGAGKSTLVRFIVSALSEFDINPETDVTYACFTGKACQVLHKKGLHNAKTLHKLLYKSKPLPDGSFIHEPVDYIDERIVVVDEVSMVSKDLINQLFSYDGIHVICLGDPGQLPPISSNDDNHLLNHPHIFLDEIMRQAQDSSIIRLSMNIREGKPFAQEFVNEKEVHIYSPEQFDTGMLTWADEILCATNRTRKWANDETRRLLGFSGEIPNKGEKIICGRNYWRVVDKQTHNPLINGTIGTVTSIAPTSRALPAWYGGNLIKYLYGGFHTESGDNFDNLLMDRKLMCENEKTFSPEFEYRLSINKKTKYFIPMEFEYGYAITVHRAQGSEWDNILVIEEDFPFSKEEHKRWLYTAVTRASSRVVLITR